MRDVIYLVIGLMLAPLVIAVAEMEAEEQKS